MRFEIFEKNKTVKVVDTSETMTDIFLLNVLQLGNQCEKLSAIYFLLYFLKTPNYQFLIVLSGFLHLITHYVYLIVEKLPLYVE